jgi:hypothetical protein
MTAEEHIKAYIAELTVQVCILRAELDKANAARKDAETVRQSS